jgi:hypothetical protein
MLENPIGPNFDDDKSIAEEVGKAILGVALPEGPAKKASEFGEKAETVRDILTGEFWSVAGAALARIIHDSTPFFISAQCTHAVCLS